MKPQTALSILLVVGCAISFAQSTQAPSQPPGVSDGYVPVHKFDSKRDAAADIQAAIVEARKTGKRILLDVGGDWCRYCHQMDQLYQEHPELLHLRDQNFITVAVYYGDDNKNRQALAPYSKVLGIPHFFVLEKDGTLLFSQHVLELRAGGKYDPDKMKGFLLKWSPPPADSSRESQ